ncbi:MAG TPA: beta-ketoacyl synthase N-terminal-like domain-containing protein [Verrucomicrobiae bacterium]|nr:beta-ketoacyl synthase N-terminal-like domain-containing protein [Verrucomicrobiae bacterium]
MNDIVVTGSAAISAAGVGVQALVEGVREGRSLLTPAPEEIAGPGGLWGKAEKFRAADFIPPLKARKFDRCSLLAVVATGLALADAGIAKGSFPSERVGITLGCGFGGIANSEEFLSGYFRGGVDALAPMLFPNTVANAAASNASIEHSLQGPNVTMVQRLCSAEAAFDLACRFIAEGRADVMITGGVDEITPRTMQAFRQMGQLRRMPHGFAEGCGLLVLESAQHAARRGAAVRGSVEGISTLGMLVPGREDEGAERLLRGALPADAVSLSGSADLWEDVRKLLPSPRVELQRITGRALAMGGLSMAALLGLLAEGEKGLHVAASPEGPYFAVTFRGGAGARH